MQHRDRRESALVDSAHEDRGHLRVQRLVQLIDDHRRQVGRVGLEAHPARQRQQDLPRVVLFAEEPLVEPLPRALAIHEGHGRGDDEERVERRAARRDLGQRAVALLHEREGQRDGGQKDENREGPVRERVLQAAAEDDARSEDVRHADGVDEAECRQEDQRVEDDGYRTGILRSVHVEERRDDRNAVADGIGEDAGNGRVERHADPAPLVRVVVERGSDTLPRLRRGH